MGIRIRGCREHNLKNINLSIPRNKLTAVIGVSGAGKSSLVIDTLLAEGQRRYMESLSSALRSSFSQLPRPEVDLVEGLSPALAVTESSSQLTRRQTVGSQTEISTLLGLLYAAGADQYSPTTGKLLKRQTVEEMVEALLHAHKEGARLQLLAPLPHQEQPFFTLCTNLAKMGFIRLLVDGTITELSSITRESPWPKQAHLVVDRIAVKPNIRSRLFESITLSLRIGRGILYVQEGSEGPLQPMTEVYLCEETGERFPPLSPADFNHSSPKGACGCCSGLGGRLGVLQEMVALDPAEPMASQVAALLRQLPKGMRGPMMAAWKSFCDQSEALDEALWHGSDRPLPITLEDGSHIQGRWKGLIFAVDEDIKARGQRSPFIALDWVGWVTCSACHGERLTPRSRAAKLQSLRFPQSCQMPLVELMQTISSWRFAGRLEPLAREVLPRIQSRLETLIKLGLGYLSLDRSGDTLSVGEAQRVQLAGEIGAQLSGVLYLFDEPARGLHPLDIGLLGKALSDLRDRGNTLVVVAHEEELLRRADHLIELGPGAGNHGGSVTFEGDFRELLASSTSVTTPYITAETTKPRRGRRQPSKPVRLQELSCHNVIDLCLDIPTQQLVGICGVSGSGKSTLLLDAVAPRLNRLLRYAGSDHQVSYRGAPIERLVVVKGEPPPPSRRSMPATYIGIMPPLRALYSKTPLARARGIHASYFSLQAKGGRCEVCQGRGYIPLEMELLPPLSTLCDICSGRRFHFEALQILWNGLSFADVLEMPAEEAHGQFQAIPDIAHPLEVMHELGLGYLALGQSFAALSGGELQRLKLVSHLSQKGTRPTLFILDEPASGLHASDTHRLESLLQRLVDEGNTVWMIEHNLDLLAQADWVIELGPGAGPDGGRVIFEGPPANLAKQKTPTGRAFVVARNHTK